MTIAEIMKQNPQGLVAKAYRFSESAHANQKRKTGEPYFVHALAAGEILAEWGLDEITIASGLLHDTVEDTEATIEQIKREFGETAAFLVDGVTKLGELKYRGTEVERSAENLRKMIVALSKDLRVIFIKLADRLHNMRTLNALPAEKQKRIALETYEIYAPIAYRLGMQHLAGELQDLSFPYLYPEEDTWLKNAVDKTYEEQRRYLERVKPIVEETLKGRSITSFEIDFRAKRYSSLYHKLLRYDMDIEKIYDLVAMRIILENTEDCYATLGIIHQLWPPMPGRIKDYIAMPKPNGYRSIHTTIIGPEKKIVEFQIRTRTMHEENEKGIAAHWLYHEKGQGIEKKPSAAMAEDIRWVQELRQWQEKYPLASRDPQEFLESLKVDFFKDRIFTITPKGEVIDLPVGATPVDFAYRVHSAIGDTCVGAKINNQFVPLSHVLHSGDLVEIMTQKNKKPSEDWLAFAKTSLARDRVRAALRKKSHALREGMSPTKTELRIVAKDRMGLMKDIMDIISRSHLNMGSIQTQREASSQFPIIKIQCDTADKSKIEKLLVKLKALKEIKEISYKLV